MSRAAFMVLGSFCAAASLLAAPSDARAELCGATAQDGGFAIERLWPMSCAVDVPVDAPVVADGSLARLRAAPARGTVELRVRRVEDGLEVGPQLAGELAPLGDGSALRFFPAAPLLPHQDYRATAVRVDEGGVVVEQLAHDFTTGGAKLPGITLRGFDVTSYAVDVAGRDCEYDVCGAKVCDAPRNAVAPHERISVHVPPIDGGLPAVQGDAYDRPYEVRVMVRRAEDGEILASARASQLRGEHGGALLDVKRGDEAFTACVEVTISDDADTTLELPEQCVEVSASEADVAALQTTEHAAGAAPLEGDMGEGGGCSLGGSTGASPWWALGLLALLVRRRRP